jgi:hypothetical protein
MQTLRVLHTPLTLETPDPHPLKTHTLHEVKGIGRVGVEAAMFLHGGYPCQ